MNKRASSRDKKLYFRNYFRFDNTMDSFDLAIAIGIIYGWASLFLTTIAQILFKVLAMNCFAVIVVKHG